MLHLEDCANLQRLNAANLKETQQLLGAASPACAQTQIK